MLGAPLSIRPRTRERVFHLEAEVDPGGDVERRLDGLEAPQVPGLRLRERRPTVPGVERAQAAVDRFAYLVQLVDGFGLRERALGAVELRRGRPRRWRARTVRRSRGGPCGAAERGERAQNERGEDRHPQPGSEVRSPGRRDRVRCWHRRTVAPPRPGRQLQVRDSLGVLVLGPVLEEPLRGLDLLIDVGVGVLDGSLYLFPDLVQLLELRRRGIEVPFGRRALGLVAFLHHGRQLRDHLGHRRLHVFGCRLLRRRVARRPVVARGDERRARQQAGHHGGKAEPAPVAVNNGQT